MNEEDLLEGRRRSTPHVLGFSLLDGSNARQPFEANQAGAGNIWLSPRLEQQAGGRDDPKLVINRPPF